MRDFIAKKKLIKFRKSGTYSRLVQRYKNKLEHERHNKSIPSDQSERCEEIPEGLLKNNQTNVIPDSVPINDVENAPNISNTEQTVAENCKKVHFPILYHITIIIF